MCMPSHLDFPVSVHFEFKIVLVFEFVHEGDIVFEHEHLMSDFMPISLSIKYTKNKSDESIDPCGLWY